MSCGSRVASPARAMLSARATLAALTTLAALATLAALSAGCDRLGLAPKFDHRETLLSGSGCDRCHDAARAGTASPTTPAPLRFDHGAHAKAFAGDCMRCHESIARGGTHSDHEAAQVKNCMRCHGGETEALACLSCHASIGPGATVPASHDSHGPGFRRGHAIAARAPDAARDCASCHARPFCGSCHDTSAPLDEARLFPADVARATAHPPEFVVAHDLEARRAPERCLGCHVEDECASCHAGAGVAAGGVTGAATVGGSALTGAARGLSPHPRGWVTVPASLGPNLHGEAARHDVVACASCHGDGASCADCHAPGGPGGSPHPPGATPRGALSDAGCAPCHAR